MGSVRINSLQRIKNRLKINENGQAQAFLTETCYKHMDKYVPSDTTNLRTNVFIDKNSITYQSPYAHYQYNGIKYVDPLYGKGAFYNPKYGYWSRPNVKKVSSGKRLNYHTAGTGDHWDRRMISAEINEVVKEVQRFVGGK